MDSPEGDLLDRPPPVPPPLPPQWIPRLDAGVTRILFVFAWLVVGGEETEVRRLAQALPRDRYRIDVVACLRRDDMPGQTHDRLRALGVDVDTTPCGLSFEDTVNYLARKIPGYDVVVSCQDVADIYPALERLGHRPPLIEHGGLVREAEAGPKHLTARYVGVCRTVRDAAAARMPGREAHAVEIPSMVDLSEFHPERRGAVRAALGVGPEELLVGWVGRLDRRKRVEDFLAAAAMLASEHPEARFVVVGGPDAFTPDYAHELRHQAHALGLDGRLQFLGDRADVPDLLVAMDALAWLSRGEGMPHVIAEAGAAGLPVVATPDNGALQQIVHDRTGLLVPHESPPAVAEALARLLGDSLLRLRLGRGLRRHVEAHHAVEAVVPQWERLLAEVTAEVPPAPAPSLFRSFVMGGWECSTHVRGDGRRLDVIAATRHDAHAGADYRQLRALGVRAMRDGLRWHLVDRGGSLDWRSWTPMLEAARVTGAQVVWDLLHYGWPDGLDPWGPAFLDRFRRFAREAALHRRERTDEVPWWCPVNEVSFFSWAGGDAGYLNPFARGRGFELKCQLAHASILAMEECLDVDPRARFLHAEPLIGVHHDHGTGRPLWEAQGWHDAQFQAFDLLSGRLWPQLGGREALLDVVGVNYYWNNQWIHAGPVVDVDHPLHRPLSDLLLALHARYGRPILVAETGTEGERRASWIAYVGAEVARARRLGAPVEGICLYPVANHPGWDDERDCHNGLLGDRPNPQGRRVHAPLAAELPRLLAMP